jgi:flagellar biosynthetic protein FliR
MGFDFLSLPRFVEFLFVFVRVGSVVAFMPVLGSQDVPALAKIGLIFIVALLVFPSISFPPINLEMNEVELAGVLFGEILIGLVIGFAARALFTAVQIAGQFVGFQMGFGIVNVIDPVTSSQISILSQFQNILAMLVFLSVDAHHGFLRALAGSYELLPVLGFGYSGPLVERIVSLTANMFVVGVKIGAPVTAALFFTNISLGLIARTVPQMNVFIVGFPLQIATGLLLMGISMPLFVSLLKGEFNHLFVDIFSLIRLMGM